MDKLISKYKQHQLYMCCSPRTRILWHFSQSNFLLLVVFMCVPSLQAQHLLHHASFLFLLSVNQKFHHTPWRRELSSTLSQGSLWTRQEGLCAHITSVFFYSHTAEALIKRVT